MDKALASTLPEFVNESVYQRLVDDMLTIAKSLGAHQAEVALQASIGLNVTVRKGQVDTLEFNRDKGIGITVYCDQRKGSASTTDISPESLQATVQAAIDLAKLTQADPFAGLANASEMAKDIPALDLYHPWDLTIEEAIETAKICEASAFNVDKKVINSEGATLSSSQSYHVYGNSHGFLGYYPTSRHNLSCVAITQDDKGMERDYEYTVARKNSQLDPAEKVGREAGLRALRRLSARKLPTQKIPVIFHANIASGIINHFMGAISGGRLFRKSSFLLDSLHTQIFPQHIQMSESPHILGALGSAPFDNDGVATNSKDIVRDGIVNSYILSAYSARKLNLPNTGNAGGVHNLFVKAGDLDFEGLLKSMGKGLLVTELMGQGVNLLTGDYSRGASGFWVENGQIQFPVHEITIAGNLKDMFKQLVAVGTDIDKRGGIQTGSLLIEEMMLAGV